MTKRKRQSGMTVQKEQNKEEKSKSIVGRKEEKGRWTENKQLDKQTLTEIETRDIKLHFLYQPNEQKRHCSYQVLLKIWGTRNPPTPLVGMYIWITT